MSSTGSKRSVTAYDIARKHGYKGTEKQWLDSLVGMSAYLLATVNGYKGTEEEWLESLKSDSLYKIAVENGFVGTEKEWLDTIMSPVTLVNGKKGDVVLVPKDLGLRSNEESDKALKSDNYIIAENGRTQREINANSLLTLGSSENSPSYSNNGDMFYVKNEGCYQVVKDSLVKIYDTKPNSILINAKVGETQETLNQYLLNSIYELQNKFVDIQYSPEDFATLEKRLTDSLIKNDLPMIFNEAIAMTFDTVPTYESKTKVSGVVSGIEFSKYEVQLYVVTSKEYFWKTSQIGSDGKWSFDNSNTGEKQVRLVEKSSETWIHTLEVPVCARSYRTLEGVDPSTEKILLDRTYTYDQAVVACALVAQNHESLDHYIKGLLLLVGDDGSVPFFVNRISGFVSRKYYRTGNAAWVYYAIAYYLSKYPNGTYAVQAKAKLDLGLKWVEKYYISDPSDVRYGLYRGGSGRFENGGTIFSEDYQVYWCACEHNIDMWFALDTAVKVGLTSYAGRRDSLKKSVVSKLWSEEDKRLYTGVNELGLDTTKYLDTSSWGGLFLLASGETVKGRESLDYLANYKFSTIDASGYFPYIKQNLKSGIWVEGTAGVALYKRAIGGVQENLNDISGVRALNTKWGYRDHVTDPADTALINLIQSCNTAWVVLAYNPNGFMGVN